MGLLFSLAIVLPALIGLVLTLPKSTRYSGLFSSLTTLASFSCIFLIYLKSDYGEATLLSAPWISSLNVDLSFVVDGLSLFFGMLVTGMGTLVNLYAQYYMDKDDPYLKRFYLYLNLFTSSMIGCVFADNLLLLFLFWELTGVSSFLLIGYAFKDQSAMRSSRMAFLSTSMTSLLLLVGIVMIGNTTGTFLWSKIIETDLFVEHPFFQTVVILCFMIAIFGKSAQMPFHFWLPNAMCAPTPISAYLHSATMVKLGVFLTARMYPLFVTSKVWFPLVVSVCLATMLIGAVLSLLSNELKKILAYATVSQLGFFISIYGMGDLSGVSYDFVHILNHAFYKGSLFMLVGIIHHTTGIHDIREIGELWKKLPVTTVIFFIATLAMAGVPGTTGFISKELVLNDLLMIDEDFTVGAVILALIVSASVFKVAFSIRLFYHLFVRKVEAENVIIHRPSLQVLIAPGILSTFALGFGIWPSGLERVVESFYVSGLHIEEATNLKVWHGWTLELIMSGLILALGAFLFRFAEKKQVWSLKHPFPDFGDWWYWVMEESIHFAEQCTLLLKGKTLSRHLAVLLLSFSGGVGGILAWNQVVPWEELLHNPGSFYRWTALIMIIFTTLSVPFLSNGIAQVLALASSGFFLTLYFIFYRAPDLAMTQILIEVVTGMMLLVMIWVFRDEKIVPSSRLHKVVRLVTALFASLAGVAISITYSSTNVAKPLAQFFLDSSIPLAKGANAVNTILVDFRGLDTLGEITVLLIAAIAIIGVVGRERRPDIAWENELELIPSDILRALAPPLFFMIQFFAVYLLLRGHNNVGGGFIAGLASAIAVILIGFSLQFKALKKLLPVNLLLLSCSGAMIAVGAGLLPTMIGKPFLTHNALTAPTTLIFDAGVFIVVLGITLISIFVLRSDGLKKGGVYGK